MRAVIGIDTGGTFTDVVLVARPSGGGRAVTALKVASTPEDPGRALLEGLRAI